MHCWWECRLVQPLWKTVWNSLKKLKMELPFDPVIPLLEIYPQSPKSPIQKKLCTPMFRAALFTIAKCWIQPKGPSVNEWIEKLVHLHNGILCSRKKEGAPAFCNRMDGRGQQLFLKCLALRWLLYHHGSQGPHCGDPDSCPSRSLCCSHPRLLLSCWGCSSQGICIY